MAGIIVYQSRSGATETYARWLSEELGFESVPVGKVRGLDRYDPIVLGSCVRMYRPAMARWILRRWPMLKTKNVVLFTVAGAAKEDGLRREWVSKALGAAIADALPHVPLNGRMDFSRLPAFDRALMKMAIRMTAKSDPRQAEEMAKEYDNVRREDLAPLVARVKAML